MPSIDAKGLKLESVLRRGTHQSESHEGTDREIVEVAMNVLS